VRMQVCGEIACACNFLCMQFFMGVYQTVWTSGMMF
jgi:hypothetical protein